MSVTVSVAAAVAMTMAVSVARRMGVLGGGTQRSLAPGCGGGGDTVQGSVLTVGSRGAIAGVVSVAIMTSIQRDIVIVITAVSLVGFIALIVTVAVVRVGSEIVHVDSSITVATSAVDNNGIRRRGRGVTPSVQATTSISDTAVVACPIGLWFARVEDGFATELGTAHHSALRHTRGRSRGVRLLGSGRQGRCIKVPGGGERQ